METMLHAREQDHAKEGGDKDYDGRLLCSPHAVVASRGVGRLCVDTLNREHPGATDGDEDAMYAAEWAARVQRLHVVWGDVDGDGGAWVPYAQRGANASS